MTCKCMNVKLYDGEHRCMECYKEFEPKRKYRYFIEHNEKYFNFLDMLNGKSAEVTLGTRRSDNLPLGEKSNG